MVMAGLRTCPAPRAVAVQQWILADSTELRQLRVSLRQALDRQFLIPGRELDDIADSMAIVATELASNALRHAQSPAVVTLSRGRRTLVLDVGDDQPTSAPRIADERLDDHGGRGLQIVQQLAQRTGWYIGHGRKHVWAQFSIPRRRWRSQLPRISVFDLDTFVRLFRRLGG
jgi:serine/threonine-protein kinase RsbW